MVLQGDRRKAVAQCRTTRSSGSSASPADSWRARLLGKRRGLDPHRRRCWPGSTTACVRPIDGLRNRHEISAHFFHRSRRSLRAAGPVRSADARAGGLPTGRNFYSVDCAPCRRRPPGSSAGGGRRCSPAAISRMQGEWPRHRAHRWGTANMRTGGDDIAQALALIGARPVWEGDIGPRHRLRGDAARGARAAAR